MKGPHWIQPHAYQCLDSFKLSEDTDDGSLPREYLKEGCRGRCEREGVCYQD